MKVGDTVWVIKRIPLILTCSILGIWKLTELVLWLFNHVTVGIK